MMEVFVRQFFYTPVNGFPWMIICVASFVVLVIIFDL